MNRDKKRVGVGKRKPLALASRRALVTKVESVAEQ